MSDIPSYIFVRADAAYADDDASCVSYDGPAIASNDDLAAMKRMILEISQDPSLLASKCDIPQLSSTIIRTGQCSSDRRNSWREDDSMAMTTEDEWTGGHDHLVEDGFVRTMTITPPPVIKAKVALSPQRTLQTQDTSTAPSPMDAWMMKQKLPIHEVAAVAPPPLAVKPYCQECNGPWSKSPQAVGGFSLLMSGSSSACMMMPLDFPPSMAAAARSA